MQPGGCGDGAPAGGHDGPHPGPAGQAGDVRCHPRRRRLGRRLRPDRPDQVDNQVHQDGSEAVFGSNPDRKISVKFNKAESSVYTLIGGGPQGSQTGQQTYIVASDDNTYHVPSVDRFKFCDDVSVLELVMLGDILTEYSTLKHDPSDIGVDQLYIDPSLCKTPEYLESIGNWTSDNLMQLNEAKSEYQIFTRSRQEVATRLSINNKTIDRKYDAKVLGVWLQPDGGWAKNTSEICKRGYSKLGMLTKLKYAGTKTEDLLQIYKLFIRSTAEYSSVVFHSNLGKRNTATKEKIQSTCLKVIFPNLSYTEALTKSGLETMAQRRQNCCLTFSLRAAKHPLQKQLFPKNKPNAHNVRKHEKYEVNHAFNEFYRNSAIPFCQRLLNKHASDQEERRGGVGEERRRMRGR